MLYIILGIGFIFLILEMLTPSLFFLNFAVAAFVCSILSIFITNITALIIIFSILSTALIFTLRPLLMKKKQDKCLETGLNSKYIGKTATAVENIDKNSGVIAIYDERWQARNIQDGIIEKGSKVEITGNESIIMCVKKVD